MRWEVAAEAGGACEKICGPQIIYAAAATEIIRRRKAVAGVTQGNVMEAKAKARNNKSAVLAIERGGVARHGGGDAPR